MSLVDDILGSEPHPDIVRENAIHDELAKMHAIATVWTTRDVRFYRPELTEQQAWEVLKLCKQRDPGGFRMSRRSINQATDKLFGSSTKHRIKQCVKVLESYAPFNSEEPLQDALIYFLADAMHWCRKGKHDFRELLRQAENYYLSE